jgi:hypothetical protein
VASTLTYLLDHMTYSVGHMTYCIGLSKDLSTGNSRMPNALELIGRGQPPPCPRTILSIQQSRQTRPASPVRSSEMLDGLIVTSLSNHSFGGLQVEATENAIFSSVAPSEDSREHDSDQVVPSSIDDSA